MKVAACSPRLIVVVVIAIVGLITCVKMVLRVETSILTSFGPEYCFMIGYLSRFLSSMMCELSPIPSLPDSF